jgi:DHA2 family multidrug resistance protein
MQRQAMMLAYKNAFAILAGVVLLLSPLVWIMRVPAKNAKVDPEQLAAH